MFDDDVEANDFFADADTDYNDVEVTEFAGFVKLGAGTHKVIVTKSGPVESTKQDGTVNKYFIIEFTREDGATYTQFFRPIEPGDETKVVGNTTQKEIKKQERVRVLTALGVPRSEIPRLNPDSLLDIEGSLRLYNGKKKDAEGNFYVKFGGFEVATGGSVGSPLKVVETNFTPPPAKQENLSAFGI